MASTILILLLLLGFRTAAVAEMKVTGPQAATSSEAEAASPNTGRVPAVSAEDAKEDGSAMKLEALVKELRLHNPQLEQARQNYRSALAVIPQVVAPNNPTVGFGNNPIPGNPLNLEKSEVSYYSVTQSFPFPGKKTIAGKIAEDQAKFTKTQIDSLYVQLVAQLKANYFQLILLNRQMDVSKETIMRLEQIKNITRVRYSHNAALFGDFLNAQVSQSSAQADQFTLQTQIDTVRQTLNTLIGRDPGLPLQITDDIPTQRLPETTVREFEDLAIKNHPNVKASELQVLAAKHGVDQAKMAILPDFQVIFFTNSPNMISSAYSINHYSYGLEFDVTIPLWFMEKEKYGIDQAKATLAANKEGDKSIRQNIKLAVDSSYNALTQAINQTRFIETRQLAQAKAAYRLGLTSFANGGMAFSDLLTAQNNLRATELSLVQSENNVIQAYVNLTAAVGKELTGIK